MAVAYEEPWNHAHLDHAVRRHFTHSRWLLIALLCPAHSLVLLSLLVCLSRRIFGLIVSGAVVILAVQAGNVIGVIFGALFFLLNLWYVYAVRHKIPFAAAMLDVSLRSMSMFRTAWLLPVVGMILMAGLAFLWLICAMSIVWAVDNGGSPDPKTGNPTNGAQSVRGLIFFVLALSLFWTILLVKGWVHTCVAGVQATCE